MIVRRSAVTLRALSEELWSISEQISVSKETLADLYVVDADVHVHENPAEMAEYADHPWDISLSGQQFF